MFSSGRIDNFWIILERKTRISTELKDLLTRIFTPCESERLTLEEIMNHPWMIAPCISSEQFYFEVNE